MIDVVLEALEAEVVAITLTVVAKLLSFMIPAGELEIRLDRSQKVLRLLVGISETTSLNKRTLIQIPLDCVQLVAFEYLVLHATEALDLSTLQTGGPCQQLQLRKALDAEQVVARQRDRNVDDVERLIALHAIFIHFK